MKRRNALKLLGGMTVVVAGGVSGFALTRTPHRALAAWDKAGSTDFADPRMRALSYAVLAPNPHNRQPWLIELNEDESLSIRFDETRQLPHTDPFDRQLTIGLGCFIELMSMAANADGYSVETVLFPEGSDPQNLGSLPIATARFTRDASVQADPLWDFVMQRRTNKDPFDTTKTVSNSDLNTILSVAKNGTTLDGTVDETLVQQWRELSVAALEIETQTPHTYKESVDLFRIGKSEIEANPDGIDFSGVFFETLSMAGFFSRESSLDASSATHQQGLDAVMENPRTAMGFVWMVTSGNTREEQIASGADWLRVNLATTSLGLGFQPLSQLLQEYPEMKTLYEQTHNELAPAGGTVQMLSRIGYGTSPPRSPRWPLESRVRLT